MNKPANLKVLLVDNDSDLLESMEELFKLFQFTVSTANSGEAAWKAIQEKDYDVVLSDIRMSSMDGINLLKKIKTKDPEKPKVIIASAFSDYPIDELYEAGADAFFHKPFEASTVRDFLWQSVMQPKQRWAIRPSAQPQRHIQQNFSSLKKAKDNGQLSLGRLGFFYGVNGELPAVDDWVEFDFQFDKEKKIPQMKGIGKVRWQREKGPTKGLPSGVGIEIKYLNENCLSQVIAWIETNDNLQNIPRQ